MGIENLERANCVLPRSTELPLLSLFDPSAYCDTSRKPTRSCAQAKKDSKSRRRRPRENAVFKFPPNRRQTDVERIAVDAPLSKKKDSPFHVLHQVLSLRVAGGGRPLGGVVVIVVVVVVVGSVVVVLVFQVGEVPRVDVGRVVRRRDGKLVVLGTAGLFVDWFFLEGREGESRSALLRSPRERRGGKRDRRAGQGNENRTILLELSLFFFLFDCRKSCKRAFSLLSLSSFLFSLDFSFIQGFSL